MLPSGCRKEKCPCKSKSLFVGDGKIREKSALFNMALTLLKLHGGKEKIPGGWNSQTEANNTQCIHGPVKGTIKKIKIILVDEIVRRASATPNMDPCSA